MLRVGSQRRGGPSSSGRPGQDLPGTASVPGAAHSADAWWCQRPCETGDVGGFVRIAERWLVASSEPRRSVTATRVRAWRW
jgi:hypothetical protein